VAIERHLVGAGRLGNRVDADGMGAAAIEQFEGGREDALARGGLLLSRSAAGTPPNKDPPKNQKHDLTGKAPYRFESVPLQRESCEPYPSGEHGLVRLTHP